MRIGIDARPATEIRAGIGTYVRELLSEFVSIDHANELLLYTRAPWQGLGAGENVSWRQIAGSDLAWNVRAAKQANRECDVYLSTISYLAPWFLTIPTVVVVHDMVSFDRSRMPNRRSALVERATIRPALRRASAIVAISESTRDDLCSSFPGTKNKTRVIHDAAQARFNPIGCGDEMVLEKHQLSRPYILAVGTLEPRKNLPRLIEAFAQLPADLLATYELVLVGARGWGSESLSPALRRHSAHVRTLGFIPTDDLPALYRRATLLAFPSVYEGFGFPVLEAMQSGTPVLASRTSSIPEIGGDAVRYVDPYSVDDIRAKLVQMLRDPAELRTLSLRGTRRAKRFAWARTAEATLELLESSANGAAFGVDDA